MRLGPILQAIVGVPALAPAAAWAEFTLGLSVTIRGRFPREVALTLGALALVEAPCLTLGGPDAPGLLLLVEDVAGTPATGQPASGWCGLGLRRPGPAAVCRGLGLDWTLADGPPALMSATLASAARALSRGYYRGLGALAPSAAQPWRLPLRAAELHIEASSSTVPDAASAAGLRALVLGRGSPSALLPAPDAHGIGPDGEWLLLRSAPIVPVTG